MRRSEWLESLRANFEEYRPARSFYNLAKKAGINYTDKRLFGRWMKQNGWHRHQMQIDGERTSYYVKFKLV